MAKVTVVETRQYAKITVVDTRRYATGRLGEGMFSRECDSQGRAGRGCRPNRDSRDLPLDAADLLSSRGSLGRHFAPKARLGGRGDAGSVTHSRTLPDSGVRHTDWPRLAHGRSGSPALAAVGLGRITPISLVGTPRAAACLGDTEMTSCLQRAVDEFNGDLDLVWPLDEDKTWPPTRQGRLDALEEIEAAQGRAARFRIHDWFGRAAALCGLPRDLVAGRILRLFGWDVALFLSWLIDATSAGAASQWSIPSFNVADGTYSLREHYPPVPFLQPGVRELPYLCYVSPRRARPVLRGEIERFGRHGFVPRRPLVPISDEIAVERGRARALGGLRCAIETLRRGLTASEQAIFECWFPAPFRIDTSELESYLEHAYDLLAGAEIRRYSDCGDEPQFCPYMDAGLPAATDNYRRFIGVFPNFFRFETTQGSVLLHEGFHLIPGFFHEGADPRNAFRLQGFVSRLCHLPMDDARVIGHSPGVGVGC